VVVMTSAPYSILITDDDAASREALREIFEPQGYRTIMAESGEEAIDIVKDQDVHLALMDMHLPRLTGLETMQIVYQMKGMLPMILISAEQDDNLLRRALSAHAYSVLSKPLSKNLVIYVVTRALEKFY
jgi:CheY-like chemotaxis protein